jgi:hypothetical protein
MTEIILILIIIIIIVCADKARQHKAHRHRYAGEMVYQIDPTDEYQENNDISYARSQPVSIREIDQDNRSRGFMPLVNQPNHTMNMWKCGMSQYNGCDGGTREITSDIYTPIRSKSVNMDLGDSSHMHITSRFGCVGS